MPNTFEEKTGTVRWKYQHVDAESLEKLALNLPGRQRATLAANLLESLPAILSDEDEGIAEALRRDSEIDGNSDQAISLVQLDSQIQNRRG